MTGLFDGDNIRAGSDSGKAVRAGTSSEDSGNKGAVGVAVPVSVIAAGEIRAGGNLSQPGMGSYSGVDDCDGDALACG